MAQNSVAAVRPADRDQLVRLLRQRAAWMRRNIVQMIYEARQGHPGGDLSAADILATLYFGVMRYDPTSPNPCSYG